MTLPVKNVCVVGAGNMGHQIALSAALGGYKVKCTDESAEMLVKANNFVDTYLPERVTKGRLTDEVAKKGRANISFVKTLEEAAGDCDFVIEAVFENLALKRRIFKQLDEIAPKHAILATNSSYIVSSKIVDVTKRPDKVCNMHFFNPALVMKCVEVVKGAHVSEETAQTTMEVGRNMGKRPVLLHKEIYGFLVNRITRAVSSEAFYLYDLGVAAFQDIDSAIKDGLGYPMGPFELMDLTGIDLAYDIRMERFRETGDPADRPSPFIVEKYIKGEWGRKKGKGFYSYEK